ncbi:unnamed protein product [Phytomonas sp. EM1]|nr:unnamed protein product [Phytomonas sp. EM1]|eukprot:CCW63631.1 unnamed protein product [Phytomonas sp. isolate EM1]
MPNKIDIQLSTRKLFFPLALSNNTIEDVVQVTNALPKIPGNVKENIVSFKAFSVVRGRYSMNPSVGFIAAGESIVLTFSLEAEYIRKHRDSTIKLPVTEEKEDSIYLFFTIVPVSMVSSCLSLWDPMGPIENTPEIQKAASTFWKIRGGSGGFVSSMLADDTITRKRLKCIFKPREPSSENLAAHMNLKGNGGVPVNVDQPNGQKPTTQNNRLDYLPVTQKSEAQRTDNQIPTLSEGVQVSSGLNASNRSAGNTTALVTQNLHGALKSSSSNRIAYDSGSGADKHWELSSVMDIINNFYDPTRVSNMLLPPVKNFLRSVLHYHIPYTFVVALLVLSFLCGIFERRTFFSWLIVGK